MAQFERTGSKSVVMTKKYPDITGGVCDFCGVRDNLQASEVQYELGHVPNCPYTAIGGIHDIRCSYCPDEVNPIEVIKQRKLLVFASPERPGELLAVCDNYTCQGKHQKRYQIN